VGWDGWYCKPRHLLYMWGSTVSDMSPSSTYRRDGAPRWPYSAPAADVPRRPYSTTVPPCSAPAADAPQRPKTPSSPSRPWIRKLLLPPVPLLLLATSVDAAAGSSSAGDRVRGGHQLRRSRVNYSFNRTITATTNSQIRYKTKIIRK
jgi:hypothetical protein